MLTVKEIKKQGNVIRGTEKKKTIINISTIVTGLDVGRTIIKPRNFRCSEIQFPAFSEDVS